MTLKTKTDRYNGFKFDSYTAVGVAEGFVETSGDEETQGAWQYLVDTGLAWSLQGWFGRTATDLINQGHIKRKGQR
jgi:hypothetical protein